MYNNNISDQGAIAIAEGLKVNASMKILGLASNKIGDAGAIAIAKALEVNANLKLGNLFVDDSIESNPQLVAACREKGVKLNDDHL